MDAYKGQGPDEAVKAWLKGGPLEGDKEAISQSSGLRHIQEFYGAFQGFDVISSREVSTNVRYVYIVLNLEKGPVFAKFNTYRGANGWMITSFSFNTKEELVFPATP